MAGAFRRLLADLERAYDGRVVALGRPQQRAVLAMLLLRANEVVGRDRLVEGLWERSISTTAKTTSSARGRTTCGPRPVPTGRAVLLIAVGPLEYADGHTAIVKALFEHEVLRQGRHPQA